MGAQVASRVCFLLCSWGKRSTPARLRDAVMGSSGAAPHPTLRKTLSTPSVPARMVSLYTWYTLLSVLMFLTYLVLTKSAFS